MVSAGSTRPSKTRTILYLVASTCCSMPRGLNQQAVTD
jgi:hypothetical protein